MRSIIGICAILCTIGFACNTSNNKNGSEFTGNDSVKQTDFDTVSIEALSSQIRQDPYNASLFSKRSSFYVENNQLDDAINDMEIAIKLDSLKPEYYFQIAEYHILKGKSGIAKEKLEKCIEIFPENTEAILKLAEVYLFVKEYKKSMELLVEVQNIDKHIPFTYYLKAIILKETGDTARSIENLQITVDKDPDFYNAYVMLGMIYADKRDSLAIAYYQNAIKIIPSSIEAHYNLGLYYQENSLFLTAIETYKHIITKIDSTYAYAHHNIGYIHMNYLKEYEEAIPWFANAIEIYPDYVQAIYHKGLCYEFMNDYESAKSEYRNCLNLVPNYEFAVDGLNRIDDKLLR